VKVVVPSVPASSLLLLSNEIRARLTARLFIGTES